MPLPDPEPGLVIPYAYLWRHEERRGLEEGRKTRPAVIVLVVRRAGSGRDMVTVAPVTHSPPPADRHAVELPPGVKRALGLDRERSWVMVDEVNEFVWPGFDIRTVPGAAGRYAYGFVPPALFDRIIGRLLALAGERRVKAVNRD